MIRPAPPEAAGEGQSDGRRHRPHPGRRAAAEAAEANQQRPAPPRWPIAVPLDTVALRSLIGPGRTVHAFSAATGRHLGVVTMTMPRGASRLGGADGAHVRGPEGSALLPVHGLRFRVEHHALRQDPGAVEAGAVLDLHGRLAP